MWWSKRTFARDRVHAFDLAPVLFAIIPIRWPWSASSPTSRPSGSRAGRHQRKGGALADHVPHLAPSGRQLSEGPIFLAGDAAHIHSPLAGAA
jgi:2-polyprenyl-6-methoxyphenol hydroxylase-like FAD-dependent oxidoreductase